MKRFRLLFLFLVSSFLFYGCIQTPDPDLPKRVSYVFKVANVGDSLTTDQESLYISEFKLLADKFNVQLRDDGILQSQPQAIVMRYSATNNGDDEVVLEAPIGYENVTGFAGLNVFFAPPAEDTNINDSDFFGDGDNYSLIIKGDYNGSNFTYRSKFSFEKKFNFEPIELTNAKQTLLLRILSDAEKVFMDEQGGYLNPKDQGNSARIDSLVKNSLSLEAFAINGLIQ